VVNWQIRFGSLGLGLVLLLFWAGCRTSPALDVNDAVLVDLMAQRLDIGRDVAWSKFNSGAAIVDAPREQAVLASLVTQATRAGVDAPGATAFFNAQILASRQLQAELIDNWQRGAARPITPPLDLLAVIRPRLDAIGAKMVAALATQRSVGPRSRRGAVQATLEARGFSPAVAHLAAEGLAAPP
jgi:chorismate mutase